MSHSLAKGAVVEVLNTWPKHVGEICEVVDTNNGWITLANDAGVTFSVRGEKHLKVIEVAPEPDDAKPPKRAKKAPQSLYVPDAPAEVESVPSSRQTQALAVTEQRSMVPWGGQFGGLEVSKMRPIPCLVSDEEPIKIRLFLADAARSAAAASVVEVQRYPDYNLVAERALGDLGVTPESEIIAYDVPGCKIVGDKVVAPAYFEMIDFDTLNKIVNKVDKLGLEGALRVCRCLQIEALALGAWIEDDEKLTSKHNHLRHVHGEVLRRDRVKIRMPQALFRLRQPLATPKLYRDSAQADFDLIQELSAKTGVRFGVELHRCDAVATMPWVGSRRLRFTQVKMSIFDVSTVICKGGERDVELQKAYEDVSSGWVYGLQVRGSADTGGHAVSIMYPEGELPELLRSHTRHLQSVDPAAETADDLRKLLLLLTIRGSEPNGTARANFGANDGIHNNVLQDVTLYALAIEKGLGDDVLRGCLREGETGKTGMASIEEALCRDYGLPVSKENRKVARARALQEPFCQKLWGKYNYAFKEGWKAIGYELKKAGGGKSKPLVWAHKGPDGSVGEWEPVVENASAAALAMKIREVNGAAIVCALKWGSSGGGCTVGQFERYNPLFVVDDAPAARDRVMPDLTDPALLRKGVDALVAAARDFEAHWAAAVPEPARALDVLTGGPSPRPRTHSGRGRGGGRFPARGGGRGRCVGARALLGRGRGRGRARGGGVPPVVLPAPPPPPPAPGAGGLGPAGPGGGITSTSSSSCG